MARNLTWDEASAQLTSHDISRSVLDPHWTPESSQHTRHIVNTPFQPKC